MPLLWAIFTAVVFFACGDTVDPSNYGKNVITEGDITNIITDVAFYKVGYKRLPEGGYWLTLRRVDEYRGGDTMVIGFATEVNYDELPPIVAKITSLETGDVQNINFVRDPISRSFAEYQRFFWIGYISPVKHESEKEPLLPDPTKIQLTIDPKGDKLTAEIICNGQTLTKTITVRGD
jgi:hypothetical protein